MPFSPPRVFGWLALQVCLVGCAGRSNTAPRGEVAAVPPAPEGVFEVATPEPLPAVTPEPAVRSIGRCNEKGDTARFTLAHFNDLQARYSDRLGGRSRYAFLAGYLRALKESDPNTLVLDAGDDYEKGSVAELRSMGEATRQMVQALPIDVRTIGNHDFAYGAAAVMRDLALSAHPVLAANVFRNRVTDEADSEEDGPWFAPFVRLDVGCARVGIVGLVTGSYDASDQPSRTPFDGVFRQDDHYVRILSAQVRAHRDEVDVMIALDHLGYGPDMVLASVVPGLDLVIGGHSEDLVAQPMPVRRRDGTRAYVLQAGHWAETLGRAEVLVDRSTHAVTIEHYGIVYVDPSMPVDEAVDRLARSVEQASAPDAHHAIGVVATPIAQGKPMADLVWRAVQDRWGADALLLGKDVFWAGLRAGPVTLQRLFDTVLVQREPSGTSGFTSLFTVEIKGADLAFLRQKAIPGLYAFYAPERLDASRTYRFVVEKRALERPGLAFYGAPRLGTGRFAGELIDVLESFARARTERALSLD